MKNTTEADINAVIELIKETIDDNRLVIVEGKKDVASMNKLGIMNCISLQRMPLFEVVEKVVEICKEDKEAAVLTDMDGEGRKLYGKISSDLMQRGIKIDNRLREALIRKIPVKQIEGLTSYLMRHRVN